MKSEDNLDRIERMSFRRGLFQGDYPISRRSEKSYAANMGTDSERFDLRKYRVRTRSVLPTCLLLKQSCNASKF